MEQDSLKFANLEKALTTFIIDFANTYKRLLIASDKKATGNLIQSIQPLTIQFTNNKYSTSISLASYWKYVNYGRKPGKFPPINAILDWIKIKPVLPRPKNGLKPPTQKQLAFLISRKIARDGIKPGRQYEQALEMVYRKHYIDISNALSADLEAYVNLVTLEKLV